MKKCISINVLNSKFPYSNDIHSVYKILNIKDHSPFKDLLELHFLDLTKVTASIEHLNELERWLLFIQTEENELREHLSRGDQAMEKASIVMKEFYSDPKERMLYNAIFMDECEKTTLFNQGKSEGIAIGKSEGIAIGKSEGIAIGKSEGIAIGKSEGISEGMANIVLFMNKKGMTVDEIENNTGLSRELIDSFIKGDREKESAL